MDKSIATKAIPIEYRRLVLEEEWNPADLKDTILDPNTERMIVIPPDIINQIDKQYRRILDEDGTIAIPEIAKVVNHMNGIVYIPRFTRQLDAILASYYSALNPSRWEDGTYNPNRVMRRLFYILTEEFARLYHDYLDQPLEGTFAAVAVPGKDLPKGYVVIPRRILRKNQGKNTYAMIWRNPIHGRESLEVVKIIPGIGNVIKIGLGLMKRFKGDFDGDTLSGILLDDETGKRLWKESNFPDDNVIDRPVPNIGELKIETHTNKDDIVKIEENKQHYTAAIVGLGLRLLAYAEILGKDESYKRAITKDIIYNLGQMALDAGHGGSVSLGKREGRNFKVVSQKSIDMFIQLFINKLSVPPTYWRILLDTIPMSDKTKEIAKTFLLSKENSLYDRIDAVYPAYSLHRYRIPQVVNLLLAKGKLPMDENRFFDRVLKMMLGA